MKEWGMAGRILRQADQWLLGADSDDDDDNDSSPQDSTSAKTAPQGTEQFLKGPAIMPGLHQVMNNPGPGGTDGTPERWPAQLPGDRILDQVHGLGHDVARALPVAVAKGAARDLPDYWDADEDPDDPDGEWHETPGWRSKVPPPEPIYRGRDHK